MGALAQPWQKLAQYRGKDRKDPAFESALNTLARQAAADPVTHGPALKAFLGWDDANLAYFLTLYRAKGAAGGKAPRLFDPRQPQTTGSVAFAACVAPDGWFRFLPVHSLESLRASAGEVPDDVVLWMKKMQAGTGSGVVRLKYLAALRGQSLSEVRLGSKGTDLGIELPDGQGRSRRVTLAEVQILQLASAVARGEFPAVLFHDVVSGETEEAIEKLWNVPCFADPMSTYAQWVQRQGCGRAGKSLQQAMPTLDRKGSLTFRRSAPGGHGLFALEALQVALRPKALPGAAGKRLVAAIGNGEDLGSSPSAAMVEWMVRERVGIAMVTTSKTGVDRQGGQIAVVKPEKGEPYVTIIETAQAKETGQLELFESLGLEPELRQREALFNTNLALFNYEVLAPKLQALAREVGESELLSWAAPDLIDKWRSQTDDDGVQRDYLQLEGAMGSCLLNLDRRWRARYGEPLVHFIHVGERDRTTFFNPIKNGFDFHLQFYSDRFKFDPRTFRLENQRPGPPPKVRLKGPAEDPGYWDDLTHVLEAFQGSSLRDLDQLEVEGRVQVRGATLKGRVGLKAGSETLVVPPGTVLENSSRP